MKRVRIRKTMPATIHRERAPFDPAIIDQARDHEGDEADADPVRLLAPKLRRERIVAHVGRAVNGDDAEDRKREHVGEQEPIEAEQLSEKGRHRCFARLSATGRLIVRGCVGILSQICVSVNGGRRAGERCGVFEPMTIEAASRSGRSACHSVALFAHAIRD